MNFRSLRGRFTSAHVIPVLIAFLTVKSLGAVIDDVDAPVFYAGQTSDAGTLASKTLAGSGWRVYFGNGLNVTLDGVTSDRAEVKIEKIAQFSDPFDRGVGPTLEIVFEQISYDAVSYIAIDSESVFNQTGSDWSGFRFNLTQASADSGQSVIFDETRTFLDDDPIVIAPFVSYALESGGTELLVGGGAVVNDSVWIPGSSNGAGELVIRAAPVRSGTKQAFFFKEQPLASTPEPVAGVVALLALPVLIGNRRGLA